MCYVYVTVQFLVFMNYHEFYQHVFMNCYRILSTCFWFIFVENIIKGDEAGFYVIGRFNRSKFIVTEFLVQFLLFALVCFTNFYGWFKKRIASLSTDQITTFLIHSKSLITNRSMLRLFSNDLCSKETCPWYLRQLVLPGRQKRI